MPNVLDFYIKLNIKNNDFHEKYYKKSVFPLKIGLDLNREMGMQVLMESYRKLNIITTKQRISKMPIHLAHALRSK